MEATIRCTTEECGDETGVMDGRWILTEYCRLHGFLQEDLEQVSIGTSPHEQSLVPDLINKFEHELWISGVPRED